MSIVEVKVPQLSESVAEATLLQWKKKPGDAVAIDETLIEVETDKVVLEVPAPAAGVMAEIVKPDGSTVLAGELIARLIPTARRRRRRKRHQRQHPRRIGGYSDKCQCEGRDRDARGSEDDGRCRDVGVASSRHRQRRPHHQRRRDRRGRSESEAASRAGPDATRCAASVARRQGADSTFPSSSIVRNSVCRCRGCVSAWQSVWCNRNRRPRS